MMEKHVVALAPSPRQSEIDSDAILNALATAIVAVDGDGSIIHVNAAGEQLLRGSATYLKDKAISNLLPEDSPVFSLFRTNEHLDLSRFSFRENTFRSNTTRENEVAAGANLRAIQLLNDHLAATPADNDAGYLLARAHANLGDHTAAALVLQTILKREPFGVRGYFLLAQISEEQGDLLRAMELLKRSIYIDAAYIPGYLELGLLYQRQGEAARARTMLTSARELLKGLPAGTEIEEYNGETAEQLMELVAASLT